MHDHLNPDYINSKTSQKYDAIDINVYQSIYSYKMLIKEINLQKYLFNTDVNELPPKTKLQIINLRKEMIEIFSATNVY